MSQMRLFTKQIQAAIEKYDELPTLVKKWKVRWFGSISRSSGLAKDDSTGHGGRKKKKKEDRRRGGKTILRNGQGWTSLAQLGQLKTGLGGEGLL